MKAVIMDLINIDKNIYFLKGSRSSNIYFLDYEKKAIIDTGHPDEIEKNLEIFKNHGIELQKADYIINTHSHGDHVGGNFLLKKMNKDIKIICSSKTILFQKLRTSVDYLKEVEDEFRDFDIDIPLYGSESFDLGGCIIEAVETTGHTIDSFSYFIREKGYIFTGDTIYHQVITQLDYYQEMEKSIDELAESYNRIKNMNPEIIFTGHGDPVKNPQENINYCMKKLNRFKKHPEMVLINNLIPALEFYIYKNPGCTKDIIHGVILKNLIEFHDMPFLKRFSKADFEKNIEKMFSLMKLLNIFEEKKGEIFLSRKLNEYIGISKI
jgi:hydroxyacylglutathione hydrolase